MWWLVYRYVFGYSYVVGGVGASAYMVDCVVVVISCMGESVCEWLYC